MDFFVLGCLFVSEFARWMELCFSSLPFFSYPICSFTRWIVPIYLFFSLLFFFQLDTLLPSRESEKEEKEKEEEDEFI